jgi:hypothetical protein
VVLGISCSINRSKGHCPENPQKKLWGLEEQGKIDNSWNRWRIIKEDYIEEEEMNKKMRVNMQRNNSFL